MKFPGKRSRRAQHSDLKSQLSSESYYNEAPSLPTMEHISQELKDTFSEQLPHVLQCSSLVPWITCCAWSWGCVWLQAIPPGSSVHRDSPGKNTGVGRLARLQGTFQTQGSNRGLLHCRILYQLSYQGSPPCIMRQLKFNTPEEHHADMYRRDLPNPDMLSARLHCWRIKWKHRGKDKELPSTTFLKFMQC